MAKMALNGYEIGIQRKIKPADHIQSMADKIQDTVVTKHPLNTDTPPPLENNLTKPSERAFKTHDNISDRIKDNLKNNHTTEYLPKPNILIPPPLPSSPVPMFNVHNTNIGISINTNDEKKKPEIVAKSTHCNVTPEERIVLSAGKSYNANGYSSSEDSYKDKVEQNYTGTLKKTSLDKSSFLNSMNGFNGNHDNKTEPILDRVYSNTLNKRKIFEKSDNVSTSFNNENKSNESTRNKTSVFDQNCKNENVKNTFIHHDEDANKKKELPDHLHNNSLYTLKTSPNNCIQFNGVERSNNDNNTKLNSEESKSSSDNDEKTHQETNDEEIVVRRRQKKNIRNDDGRRDSHIIARPMSTIQCADVADGLYPVCHKCDKAITR